MKTTTPQITVKPDTQKVKKDGQAPIYIYCSWRGRARMTTGIYCLPSEFNSKTLSIKSQPEKSKRLRDLLASVEENITTLTEPYTAKDCLTLKPKQKGLSYINLLSEMSKRRGLAESNIKKYLTSYHAYQNTTTTPFEDNSESDWKGIAKTWKNQGTSLTTIWVRLSCFKAILNYALETGRIKDNPLNNWRFKKDGYKAQTNPRALTKEEVDDLWNWWIMTEDFAGLLWFASYYFNGLALCDLLKMDWNNVKFKFVGGMMILSGGVINRSKTNEPVPIVCPVENNSRATRIFGTMQLYSNDLKKRSIANWSKLINKHLKKSPIPDLTFYSARHTYCTNLVNSNIPLTDIATLLGRNVEGLSVYIRQLQTEEHLAKILDKAMTK